MTKRKGDMFGFDDEVPRASVLTDEIQAGDDRTLRLAAPFFTAEQLDQFLAYQRALRDRLSASPLHADQWDTYFSRAHQAALSEVGLSVADHARISAVAAKYCAHLTTQRALREKQAGLRKRLSGIEATGADASEDDRELDRRFTSELLRYESLSPLERRYGREAVTLLQGKEAELLELHSELARRMAPR